MMLPFNKPKSGNVQYPNSQFSDHQCRVFVFEQRKKEFNDKVKEIDAELYETIPKVKRWVNTQISIFQQEESSDSSYDESSDEFGDVGTKKMENALTKSRIQREEGMVYNQVEYTTLRPMNEW